MPVVVLDYCLAIFGEFGGVGIWVRFRIRYWTCILHAVIIHVVTLKQTSQSKVLPKDRPCKCGTGLHIYLSSLLSPSFSALNLVQLNEKCCNTRHKPISFNFVESVWLGSMTSRICKLCVCLYFFNSPMMYVACRRWTTSRIGLKTSALHLALYPACHCHLHDDPEASLPRCCWYVSRRAPSDIAKCQPGSNSSYCRCSSVCLK